MAATPTSFELAVDGTVKVDGWLRRWGSCGTSMVRKKNIHFFLTLTLNLAEFVKLKTEAEEFSTNLVPYIVR